MVARVALVCVIAAALAGTALAGAGDPERRAITKADQAVARKANLTLRDVPAGFRQGPQLRSGSSGGLTCASFAPDLSAYTITGQAMSHVFARSDGTSLFSSAEVFKRTSDEVGDWRKTARRSALPCVAQMLEQQSTGAVQLTVASSSLRPAPRLGDRAISFRVVARVTAGNLAFKGWFDILAVSRGRMDATLAMLSFRKPPSSAVEQSLLATLASRLSG
jgi:hypothetical protein